MTIEQGERIRDAMEVRGTMDVRVAKRVTAILRIGMVKMNSNMHEMTGRLYNMNRSVNSMAYDVNEMATLMNTGPMSDFWPR